MNIRILLVEDNVESMDALTKVLKKSWKMPALELEIIGVRTLEEAWKFVEDANATIMDFWLPGVDRQTQLAAIKNFPPPVIVLTADTDPELETDCLAAGAAHVFHKGTSYVESILQHLALIPAVLEALQRDILRRAEARELSILCHTGTALI